MKRLALGVALFASIAWLTGCATPLPQGAFYTGVKLPVSASGETAGTKVGMSKAESFLGLVAIGDASIEAAKANGGITKVSYVDYQVENYLGAYGKYTTTVYGE